MTEQTETPEEAYKRQFEENKKLRRSELKKITAELLLRNPLLGLLNADMLEITGEKK